MTYGICQSYVGSNYVCTTTTCFLQEPCAGRSNGTCCPPYQAGTTYFYGQCVSMSGYNYFRDMTGFSFLLACTP
jgi:hypothetical protein